MSTNDVPVFSWWHDGDHAPLAAATAHWSAAFAQFEVTGPDDVAPLMERHFPQHRQTWDALAVPAARSDVARLLLLHARGGLYIDNRCGIRDGAAIQARLAALAAGTGPDLALVARFRGRPDKPPGGTLANGILFARADSSLLLTLCAEILANLAWHRALEQTAPGSAFVPYDVWSLCGPGVYTHTFLDPARGNAPRAGWQGRVEVLEEAQAPVQIAAYRSRQPPEAHWASWQRRARLFHSQGGRET
jgi:hypothetical protein